MRRLILRFTGLVLAAAMLSPAFGLLSALVDRPEAQSAQIEAFSLALTIFDPLVQQSLRNSFLVALGVSLGSMALGLSLAGITRRGGRAGRALQSLASLTVSTPLVFLSLGVLSALHALFGPAVSPPSWARILGWVWVELIWGVGLVTVSASTAMRNALPIWEEAARLAGGRPWLTWRVVVRPVVMPSVARSGSWVFACSLVEPTAPLLLGLNRTLASRIIDAALGSGSDPVARAPALVLLALGLSAAVRAAFLLWGGHRPDGLELPEPAPRPASSRSSILRASLALLAFALLALGPMTALAHSAWSAFPSAEPRARALRIADWFDPIRPSLTDSAILGASAASLALLASTVACSIPPGSRLDRLSLWVPSRMPGLPIGIGALGLVWLLGDASWNQTALSRRLDPFTSPGLLLILVVALVHIPRLTRLLRARAAFSHPSQREAALLLGGPRSALRRFRTILWPSVGPPLLSAWLWTALLSAFETASALVLTPTTAFRPLSPTLIDLATSSANVPQAASLALAGWLAVFLGFLSLRPRDPSSRT